jgi:integrase
MATIQKRPTGDGKMAYRALVRLKGYPATSATFERLTDAKDWAQKTEAAMKERRYFKDSEAKKHTMAETIDRYLTRTEKTNPKRHREIKPMLEWWKKEIGHCILADLTKTLLSEKTDLLTAHKRKLRNSKEKPRSAARVNRFLSALSHVFTIAVNEWEWLETHPMQKIKPMKEPRGRVRFLDSEERERLLAACKASDNPYLYAVVVLALSTGARLNEIMTLRWRDVDFERNTITLHETKNGDRRLIPLAGHALDTMRDHAKVRNIKSNLVFPAPKDPAKPYYIRTSWHTAIKKAKITDFRFHDLRHSAASYLAMSGATPSAIADVLGHKSLQMVKRYAHLSEAHTHAVVASMNHQIFGTPEKEKTHERI